MEKARKAKPREAKKKSNSHFKDNAQTPLEESLFYTAICMGLYKVAETILRCTKQYLEEKNEGEMFLKRVREDDDNSVLLWAIEHSRAKFVEDFIRRQQFSNLMMSSESITKALEMAGTAKHGRNKNDAMKVAKSILASFQSKERYSPEVIGLTIKHDLDDLWDGEDKKMVQEMGCKLHMAVLHERVNVIKKGLPTLP